MDAIEFIQKDMNRGRKKLWVSLAALTFLCPVLLGIFLRDDLNGVFEPRVFSANLGAAALLSVGVFSIFKQRFSSSKAFAMAIVFAFLALFFATDRIFFPVAERTPYATDAIFRVETSRCFLKGAFETSILGACLVISSFLFSSWPSRRWRALISVIAGVSGTVMLGFHCDSSSVSHVALGHIGQGVLVGLIFFGLQEFFFRLKMRSIFPGLINRGLESVTKT
jgi:hypothetical protein